MREGDAAAPASHGICMDCLHGTFEVPIESVDSLTPQELDRLPAGLVRLAPDGTIFHYNQAESRLSGQDPLQMIGKNFFTVAPCAAVKGFKSEFDDLVRQGSGRAAFSWIFEFPSGKVFVNITLVKDADDHYVNLFVRTAQ
jgi:photoactive yellow protein